MTTKNMNEHPTWLLGIDHFTRVAAGNGRTRQGACLLCRCGALSFLHTSAQAASRTGGLGWACHLGRYRSVAMQVCMAARGKASSLMLICAEPQPNSTYFFER